MWERELRKKASCFAQWKSLNQKRSDSREFTEIHRTIHLYPKGVLGVCVCVRVNFRLKNETVNFSTKAITIFYSLSLHSSDPHLYRCTGRFWCHKKFVCISKPTTKFETTFNHTHKKRSHNNRSRRSLRHSGEAFASINTSNVHAYVRIQTSV